MEFIEFILLKSGKRVDMNFSFIRFIYGMIGAFLCAAVSLHFTQNIETIITLSAVSFVISFCWLEYIYKFFCEKDDHE